jgi:RNA polymerase sigma-70 factor (ECF subfamily)
MAKREPDRSARLMHHALAYADGLYNFARHLSHNATEAEDLVQETYARALGAAGQFEEGGNLKAWLYRILRNTFLDLYRREQRARTDSGLDTVVDERGPTSDEGAAPRQARVAVLLDLEGFSEAEMAELLGCAPGTVKSRLFRARAALRERLQR